MVAPWWRKMCVIPHSNKSLFKTYFIFLSEHLFGHSGFQVQLVHLRSETEAHYPHDYLPISEIVEHVGAILFALDEHIRLGK